jgi:transcriptional regulator with XRE-family HTH domain
MSRPVPEANGPPNPGTEQGHRPQLPVTRGRSTALSCDTSPTAIVCKAACAVVSRTGRTIPGMGAESTTSAQVGERLRSIRQQKGLTLHDVEALSRTEFKASVLGAYERGERAISVHRILRLAEIYQVARDHLLPRDTGAKVDLAQRGDALDESFTIDLERLRSVDDAEASVLSRYATAIQFQRQDVDRRLLTVRRDELNVLAAVLGRTPEDFTKRLDELGLRANANSD